MIINLKRYIDPRWLFEDNKCTIEMYQIWFPWCWLDRSQPLFYFVPQEILTVKLARLDPAPEKQKGRVRVQGINSKGAVADLDNLEANSINGYKSSDLKLSIWQHHREGRKAWLGGYWLLMLRVRKGVHLGWENWLVFWRNSHGRLRGRESFSVRIDWKQSFSFRIGRVWLWTPHFFFNFFFWDILIGTTLSNSPFPQPIPHVNRLITWHT